MQQLVEFSYPNEEAARTCQAALFNIKQASASAVHALHTIGESLVTVRETLGYGAFGKWLETHLPQWGTASVYNYINAYHALEKHSKLWNYEPSVIYLFTSRLPENARTALLEAGPVSVEEAKRIVEREKAADWRDEVETLVETDPGQAYYAIEQALDTNLREEALDALNTHKERFALLSDRDPEELLQEAGMTVKDRYKPMSGRPNVSFRDVGGHAIFTLWNSGQPKTLVEIPAQSDPVLAAWAADAKLTLCRRYGIT